MGQHKCSIEEYQALGLRAGILNTNDFINPDQKLKVLMALQNAKYHRPSIYTSANIKYNKSLTNRTRKRRVQQQKLKPIFNKLKDANSFRKSEVTKVRENEKLLTNSERGSKTENLNMKDISRKARIDQGEAITSETSSHPENLARTFGHCVITKEEEKRLLKHLLSLLHGKKAIKEAERKILDDLWSKKVRQRKESLTTVAKESATTKPKKGLEKTEVDANQTEECSRAEEIPTNQAHDCQNPTKNLRSKMENQSSETDASSKNKEMIKRQEPWRIQHRLLSRKLNHTSRANPFSGSFLQSKERPDSCKEDEMSIQDDLSRLPLTNAHQVYFRHGYSKISSAQAEECDSFKLPLIEGQDDAACYENSLCPRYTGEKKKSYCTSRDDAARKTKEDEETSKQPVDESQHSEKVTAFLPPIYTEHHPFQSVQTENKRVINKKLVKSCGKNDPKHHKERGRISRRSSESTFLKNTIDEKRTRKYSIKKDETDSDRGKYRISTKERRRTTPLRGFTPLSDERCESPWLLGSTVDERLD